MSFTDAMLLGQHHDHTAPRHWQIEMSDFSKRLPKVELHAHLTGSISRQSLHEIWQRKKLAGELTGDADAQDPLKAIPPAANGVNIKT